MTGTTGFVLFAALIVVLAVALLLPPLLRQRKATTDTERREANLAIFRDQLGELERERDEASLSPEDFEQAQRELQRRLLEETQPEATPAAELASPPASRNTAIALLILLPVAAALGYAALGTPRGLDPMQTQAPRNVTPEQMQDMVSTLAEKLKQNPEDANGWVMLARSYKVLGRYAEAADAYSRAGKLVDQDAGLLADYAEMLSQVNNGSLLGKPSEMIARALKLDPEDSQTLLLAGAAASERRDFGAAAEHWGKLLTQLEPGSEEAKTVEAAVARARSLAGKPADKGEKAAAGAAVNGEVRLSPALAAQAKPEDVLFVFAMPANGERMPLAVMRASVADLPVRFSFDDSMALPGGKKISDFPAITVEARVAKAGQAKASSGDLFGRIENIKPGGKALQLSIDKVQP